MSPPVLAGSGATRFGCAHSIHRRAAPGYQLAVQQHILNLRLGETLQDPENLTAVSAMQAISDLAELPVGNRRDEMSWEEFPGPSSAYQRLMRAGTRDLLSNVQVPRINKDTVLRLKGIPQGGNHRDLQGPLLERFLTGQRWGQDNGTGRLSRKHFYALSAAPSRDLGLDPQYEGGFRLPLRGRSVPFCSRVCQAAVVSGQVRFHDGSAARPDCRPPRRRPGAFALPPSGKCGPAAPCKSVAQQLLDGA